MDGRMVLEVKDWEAGKGWGVFKKSKTRLEKLHRFPLWLLVQQPPKGSLHPGSPQWEPRDQLACLLKRVPKPCIVYKVKPCCFVWHARTCPGKTVHVGLLLPSRPVTTLCPQTPLRQCTRACVLMLFPGLQSPRSSPTHQPPGLMCAPCSPPHRPWPSGISLIHVWNGDYPPKPH